jgi:hypothetical protein
MISKTSNCWVTNMRCPTYSRTYCAIQVKRISYNSRSKFVFVFRIAFFHLIVVVMFSFALVMFQIGAKIRLRRRAKSYMSSTLFNEDISRVLFPHIAKIRSHTGLASESMILLMENFGYHMKDNTLRTLGSIGFRWLFSSFTWQISFNTSTFISLVFLRSEWVKNFLIIIIRPHFSSNRFLII